MLIVGTAVQACSCLLIRRLFLLVCNYDIAEAMFQVDYVCHRIPGISQTFYSIYFMR